MVTKDHDLKDAISSVVKSGKIKIGFNSVRKSLLSGNLKLIIISSNCPQIKKEDIIYYSKLSKIDYCIVEEGGLELGSMCGKPFPVSAIGIVDEGDSDIFKVIKKI